MSGPRRAPSDRPKNPKMHPAAQLAARVRAISGANAARLPDDGSLFKDTYRQERSEEPSKLGVNDRVADALIPVKDALGPLAFAETIAELLDAPGLRTTGWARHFYGPDRVFACNYTRSALDMMAKAEALGAVVAFMPMAQNRKPEWDRYMDPLSLATLVAQAPVEASLVFYDAMCAPDTMEADLERIFEYTLFSARAVFAITFIRSRGGIDKAAWKRNGRVAGFARHVKALCQRKSRSQATLLLSDFDYGSPMVTLIFSVFSPKMPPRGEVDDAAMHRLEERDALCGRKKAAAAAVVLAPDMFVVEAILEQRGSGRCVEYLVAWRGYDDRTWEPECNVPRENAALQAFLRKRKKCGHCSHPVPDPPLVSAATGKPVGSCQRCFQRRGGKIAKTA